MKINPLLLLSVLVLTNGCGTWPTSSTYKYKPPPPTFAEEKKDSPDVIFITCDRPECAEDDAYDVDYEGGGRGAITSASSGASYGLSLGLETSYNFCSYGPSPMCVFSLISVPVFTGVYTVKGAIVGSEIEELKGKSDY